LGCKSSGFACSTAGAGTEEVVTNALTGNLRVEKFGTVPSKTKLADELVPTAEGGVFVKFQCGGVGVELRKEATGGLLNPLVGDKMLKTETVKYTASKGEQKPSEYEAVKGEKILAGVEASIGGGPFEETGLTSTSTQTNEEAVEANAVT